VAVIAAVLLVFRIWLPIGVKHHVNEVLAAIPGYRGSVSDIDLALLRGAYAIKDLHLNKLEAESEVPFLSIDRSDISIEWRALLHRRIVSDVVLLRPQLIYVREDHSADSDKPDESDWTHAVRNLAPIDINHLEITDGKLAFVQLAADPDIDLHLEQIALAATNLRNVLPDDGALESNITATAISLGQGKAELQGRMSILKKIPDVDLAFSLEGAQASAFNSFSKHYANLDFSEGKVSVYAELAIADGQLVGYVKPILEDIELVSRDQSILENLWEGIVEFAAFVLENRKQETVATKVPFKGDLRDLDTGVFAGVLNIFHHAWIEAFQRSVDNDVDYRDAKELSE
jgi:hypothetical protein